MASILESKGVEFSDFPLREDSELDLVAFNDLSLVDGWTYTLRVEGIREIVLYRDGDTVVGIELVYLMSDGNNSPRIIHGQKTGDPTKIQVSDNERVIAAFVGIDKQQNKIKSLRFTKTGYDDGIVTTEGITSTLNLEYSAAYGEISAFRGTKIRGDGGPLVTLGVQTNFYGPATKSHREFKHVPVWLPAPVHSPVDARYAWMHQEPSECKTS